MQRVVDKIPCDEQRPSYVSIVKFRFLGNLSISWVGCPTLSERSSNISIEICKVILRAAFAFVAFYLLYSSSLTFSSWANWAHAWREKKNIKLTCIETFFFNDIFGSKTRNSVDGPGL